MMSTPSTACENLLLLEDVADFQQHALQLAKQTRRHLAILSRTLDAPIYDNDAFVTAISQLARASRYTIIQLLVKDTDPLIERGHRLVRLSQKLSSKIILRKLTLEPNNSNEGFMLCDENGLLYKNNECEYRGFANDSATANIKHLRETFDYLWQHAVVEPRLQLLHI
jgi:hypothetical protein